MKRALTTFGLALAAGLLLAPAPVAHAGSGYGVYGSGASSSGEGLDTPKVQETLESIMGNLKEKRQDNSRPEDLMVRFLKDTSLNEKNFHVHYMQMAQ